MGSRVLHLSLFDFNFIETMLALVGSGAEVFVSNRIHNAFEQRSP